jgi:hypothetical protein
MANLTNLNIIFLLQQYIFNANSRGIEDDRTPTRCFGRVAGGFPFPLSRLSAGFWVEDMKTRRGEGTVVKETMELWNEKKKPAAF